MHRLFFVAFFLISLEIGNCQSPPYSVKFFDQKIDHFNFVSNGDKTFKQRYIIKDDLWRPGKGPIFFYTGNEGPITAFWDATGFVFDIAPQFEALVVFVEHLEPGNFQNVWKNLASAGKKARQQLPKETAKRLKLIQEQVQAVKDSKVANSAYSDQTWRDAPNGKQYIPSHNIAPGAHTPVMFSSKHVPDSSTEGCERVIQPMLWGLVPSWHKGVLSDKAFETNNCRAESMLDKSTYKVPLQKGRRCVILAEGFFEWKRDKEKKQPYYIYFPQTQGENGSNTEVEVKGEGGLKVKREPVDTENEQKPELDDHWKLKEEPCNETTEDQTVKCEDDQEDESAGLPKLLTMAGVFDVWEPKGSELVYSYSVITVESSPAMSWIHHRMPAMLTSDEEIDQWLSFGEVPLNKAAKLIRPVTSLVSHPVSTVVNNSRNNTPACVKRIDLSKPKLSASGNMMMSWLTKAVKKEPGSDGPPSKRAKIS